MPAGQELAALKQLVRLIDIYPSASGGDGTSTVRKRKAP
jgi:hypothetical protein